MKHYARRTTLVLAASVTIALVLTATVTIALAYGGRSTSASVAARAWPMPSVAPAQADGSATVAKQKSGVLPAAPTIAARNSPPLPCDDSVCKAEAFGQQGLQSDFGPTVLSDFESGASDTQLGTSEMIVGAQTADGRDLFNLAPLGGFESASVAAPAPEISTAAMVALGVVLLITRRTGRSRWASWKARGGLPRSQRPAEPSTPASYWVQTLAKAASGRLFALRSPTAPTSTAGAFVTSAMQNWLGDP